MLYTLLSYISIGVVVVFYYYFQFYTIIDRHCHILPFKEKVDAVVGKQQLLVDVIKWPAIIVVLAANPDIFKDYEDQMKQ